MKSSAAPRGRTRAPQPTPPCCRPWRFPSLRRAFHEQVASRRSRDCKLQIGNFQFPIFNPAKADDFAVAAKLDNFVSRHLNTELAHPPRVAYVIKMFPRLSETFILNEVLE